jgi:hypothetical protein
VRYWSGWDLAIELEGPVPEQPWQATLEETPRGRYLEIELTLQKLQSDSSTPPPRLCDVEVVWYPLDVIAQIAVRRSGFRYVHSMRRFCQTVTVQNTGAVALPGPVSLALNALSPNAVLENRLSVTRAIPPLGRPFLRLSDGSLNPGAAVAAVLQFRESQGKGITYGTSVYAGPGTL